MKEEVQSEATSTSPSELRKKLLAFATVGRAKRGGQLGSGGERVV